MSDNTSPNTDINPYASFTTLAQVSVGITIGQCNDGAIVLSAHKDKNRVLFEMTKEECRKLASDLMAFCDSVEKGSL